VNVQLPSVPLEQCREGGLLLRSVHTRNLARFGNGAMVRHVSFPPHGTTIHRVTRHVIPVGARKLIDPIVGRASSLPPQHPAQRRTAHAEDFLPTKHGIVFLMR
jgi:hypothetical protein